MTSNAISRPNRTYRLLVLVILFMAGGGLDIKSLLHLSWPFSFVYLSLLFVMTARFIRVNSHELSATLMSFVTMLIAYIMKGAHIEWWILTVVFQGYLVLAFYKNWPEKFAGDLSRLCQLYMYYTLVGITLQYLMGGVFYQQDFTVTSISSICSTIRRAWSLAVFASLVWVANLASGKCSWHSICCLLFTKNVQNGRYYWHLSPS